MSMRSRGHIDRHHILPSSTSVTYPDRFLLGLVMAERIGTATTAHTTQLFKTFSSIVQFFVFFSCCVGNSITCFVMMNEQGFCIYLCYCTGPLYVFCYAALCSSLRGPLLDFRSFSLTLILIIVANSCPCRLCCFPLLSCNKLWCSAEVIFRLNFGVSKCAVSSVSPVTSFNCMTIIACKLSCFQEPFLVCIIK